MPDGSGTLLARTLVGRDAELAALQEAWRDGGAARVVTAPAGRRQEPARARAGVVGADDGGLVLAGRCSPTGQDTPLRPWREALLAAARAGRDAGRRPRRRSCRRWRGWCRSGARPPTTPPPLVLGEAVLRLLSSWATPSAATLLVIEDLQWADPESLAVLEYVVDNLAGAPLLVVATLRDGEPGAGADLAADLDRPASRRSACRLAPLTDDEVLAVARSCLDGGDLPDDAARRAGGAERGRAVPRGGAARHRGALRVGHHHRRRARLGHRVGGHPARRPPTGRPPAAHRRRAARPSVRLDPRGRHRRASTTTRPPSSCARRCGRSSSTSRAPASGSATPSPATPCWPPPLPTEQIVAGRPGARRAVVAADPGPPGRAVPARRPARRRRRPAPTRPPRCGCEAAERALDDGSLALGRSAGHPSPRRRGRRRAPRPPTWCCCGRAPSRARPIAPPRWAPSCSP